MAGADAVQVVSALLHHGPGASRASQARVRALGRRARVRVARPDARQHEPRALPESRGVRARQLRPDPAVLASPDAAVDAPDGFPAAASPSAAAPRRARADIAWKSAQFRRVAAPASRGTRRAPWIGARARRAVRRALHRARLIMIPLKNILVATDFGEASDAALNYGRALARTFGATLHVLHVAENVFTRGIGGEGLRRGRSPTCSGTSRRPRASSSTSCSSTTIRSRCRSQGASCSRRTRPAMAIVDYAEGGRHRPDRDGHARTRRGRAPAHGQRRRARRPDRAVPGADGAVTPSTSSSCPTRSWPSPKA